MDLQESIQQFYFSMTVNDLRRLHRGSGAELSYNSVMYLDLISYHSGREGGCTVSGLAKLLGVSKPAVTMKVNELAAMGLVERVQNPGDKRVYHLRVSRCVEESLESYDLPLRRGMRRVRERFTPEQIESFCAILDTFSKEFSVEEP